MTDPECRVEESREKRRVPRFSKASGGSERLKGFGGGGEN